MYRDQWTYCCQEWEADDDNQDPYWLRGDIRTQEENADRFSTPGGVGALGTVGGGESEES